MLNDPPNQLPQEMNLKSSALSGLPNPSTDQILHSQALAARLLKTYGNNWFSFEQFMQAALYEPALGYYAAGQQKFGASGDFVTAPQVSPLFAKALANQLVLWLEQTEPRLIEFGAGDGTLAAQLLLELEQRAVPLTQYCIAELSPDLKQRQRAMIEQQAPNSLHKVVWLDQLPERLNGVIFGNELIDAMPVRQFALEPDGIKERGVTIASSNSGLSEAGEITLAWQNKTADASFASDVKQILHQADGTLARLRPSGFYSELCPAANAWLQTISQKMGRAVLLLIDYGFPRHEFYLPERSAGTVMCHYRHFAHSNPLLLPGLQDITAHVDFSALAQAAEQSGLELLGYTSQARFLINCGLIESLATSAAVLNPQELLVLNHGVQRLLSEAEMGELFKVIAFARGIDDVSTLGFRTGDRSHTLEIQSLETD